MRYVIVAQNIYEGQSKAKRAFTFNRASKILKKFSKDFEHVQIVGGREILVHLINKDVIRRNQMKRKNLKEGKL